ncbi:hypothetical protein SAY87_010531 [Trapa incisa]|uniref:Core-2/I-branching beta-1,6-N-acetylglucosaminyltransferase family protein n=1 Tax=Trapa incisa TaxID=236973 RepID=A0AAN7JHP2_9MYRT|nr:hypothetical protein SAY87_010531 [Trapa incisa]
MIKKQPPPVPTCHVLWLGWKIIILFSVSLCAFGLFRLHHKPRLTPLAISSDRSLSFLNDFSATPKIAFLFLARRNLPLDFLWSSFFEDADAANFSIYVHSEPDFVLDESTTRSRFFYNRQLRNSIQVVWGEASMVEAEKILFSAALEDPANQRFVLLSDSCVPLYNFSYIYKYLMHSQRSFVDSFIDAKEERYNPKMSPSIPREKWRKGSQWIALIRRHAVVLVNDYEIISIFKNYCKRRPPVDASMGKLNIKLQKQNNCIPDEHYVQTLFAMNGVEPELERRTLTYTLWNQSSTINEKGWHPFKFSYADASPKRINEIKNIDHVYYETDHRTEWCHSNTTFVPCFLFARKFSQGAAMRLLSEGLIAHFNGSTLLDSHP